MVESQGCPARHRIRIPVNLFGGKRSLTGIRAKKEIVRRTSILQFMVVQPHYLVVSDDRTTANPNPWWFLIYRTHGSFGMFIAPTVCQTQVILKVLTECCTYKILLTIFALNITLTYNTKFGSSLA